ncbi:MAG: preprotein translocase subunit SecA [Gammaproteobacteria bacterium]|jgi:preprotein translocase subunit SecA|nr:preprotein translocase subunit SecA [Gammaproteobacteria bacterium]MBT3724924.1 preprotein translocase subunit SecA [Gammaproteobacteria bacterium]MBT6453918.1 preprotein translocase subunit SecA [Gammaproteobacteria bacterium]MBT6702582.1 preprotein translocase subunit SecA [Gammaproteobacteria bacterium]
MLSKTFRKIFGSRNDRIIKILRKSVNQINALEADIQTLSDEQIAQKTTDFKERYQQGETLEQLLPEAFAVCREASSRTLGMRHYDVQFIGAMILNNNQITEMKTGEGKTLVATLAAYLNALSDKGVHIVTVNDYLAERDSQWMGKLYNFLGLSVGVVLSTMDYDQKREAYKADITYGTNNQFGFDYMHDNLSFSLEERVQRELNFAIIDEVDSILIDEARTPLIISGQASDSSELYKKINVLIPRLTAVEVNTSEGDDEDEEAPGDYTIDEKAKQVFLTEQGHESAEKLLVGAGLLTVGESLYDSANISLVHHLNAAMRAHIIYHKDVDYIVQDNQIVIVDEFTGRTMPGRRWSEGLHQAIEAKESVDIQNENQTIASITFQNYFRLYSKLSGMTGTADTEAFEFQQIYGLEVVVVPTDKDMVRKDMGDLIYLTAKEKYNAVIEDVKDCVSRKQPVLVGTTSVEVSEFLSGLLDKDKIKHQILNAKQHEREAGIIADAGLPSAVTIATNMAGRGTDIVLGGNYEFHLNAIPDDQQEKRDSFKSEWEDRHAKVIESGGLHIIGTERHESRRIDNQLRGRSGRQGDPGSSRFYLSMEDTLMRIFASGKVAGLMQKLGMEEGEAIEHPWVTKAIENAQRKVEAHNFDIRKHLLDYDDVANDQRKVIYQQRDDLLKADSIEAAIKDMRLDVMENNFRQYVAMGSIDEQWDIEGLTASLTNEFGEELNIQKWIDEDDHLDDESILEKICDYFEQSYVSKVELVGADVARRYEKEIMLMVLDRHWKEHLAAMDHLRQGIGLRGYAQKNPIQEFKRESFQMFEALLENIKTEAITILTRIQVQSEEEVSAMEQSHPEHDDLQLQHAAAENVLSDAPQEEDAAAHTPFVRKEKKLGRNEPCWCGSGKKFKQCHGKLS